MKKIKKILIGLLIYCGIASSSLTIAQESDSTVVLTQSADTTYLPSRGKHIFTSISSVDDPFVSTKFLLGVGMAKILDTEIPITIGEFNKTVNFKPDIVYYSLGIEFQYAIRNWAAVNIKTFGLARFGNNFLSLASEGVSSASSFSIGWLFRIAEGKDIMFSGSIALQTTDLTLIDILGREDTTITPIDTLINRQIISNYQSLTTQTDLRFAVRFSDVFGLVTKLSGALGENYGSEKQSQFQYTFGMALSIDLRNWLHIPFGIGLGGTIVSSDWRFREAKPPIYSGNITIAFYNRNDFTIGIENYLQVIEPQQYEQTLSLLYSRIYISYYF